MRQRRFLSWVMAFALLVGMLAVPAYAEGNTAAISGNGTADKTGSMTVTLVIPKKTPVAADLTYAAPSNLTYSGSDKAATVAAASGVTGLGAVTVKYYSDAARTTEATPKNVGAYYVGATLAEGDQYAASTAVLYDNSWTFEITASTPSAPDAPTKAGVTKNSITLNTVSGCEYSKDGSSWQDSAEFTGLLPGTEYTFYQRVKETANTNASDASQVAKFTTEEDTYGLTITLVVPKKTPAATDMTYTAPTNLVYNGSNKTATVAAATGVTGLGEITVKYYSDAARTTEVTETRNVGTYYVGATVTEGDQYAASTAVVYGDGWTFAITPSTPSAPAAPTKASGSKTTITLNAVDNCEYSKDGASWQSSAEFTGLLPGTEYTFYQRIKATANTNPSAASQGAKFTTEEDTYGLTITLVIKPAQTITASDVTATYGDTDKSVSASVTDPATGGGAITYAVKDGSAAVPVNTAAGTYDIVPSGATASDNYTITYTNGTLTISDKGTQTITASDVTVTYGDTGKSVSASVTDPTEGGGAISYAVKAGSENYIDVNASTGALTIKKAGTATVVVTAAETQTYAAATKEVTVTINTKAMTVSATGYTGYYDEQAHGITVTVTEPATGYTVKYGTTEGTYDSTTSPTQTEAGTKTVYYQVTADNYTTKTGSATVTVNAKQAQTITAQNVTVTYGDTGKSVSASVTNPTTGTGAITYAVKAGSGDYIDVNASTGALTIKKAGTATVIVTAAETQTCAAATKEVTVTINKATAPAVTVPTPSAVTYDPTKTLANVTLSNGWTWVTDTTVPTVGNSGYAAALTVDDANYDYTSVEGYDVTTHKVTRTVSLTVNKATVTAPTIASKVYNGKVQTADVAASTLYTVTTNNGGKDVGSYNVVLTLTDSTNYKWTDSTAAAKTMTFTITKATAPAVTVPTPSAVTYDPTKTLADVTLSNGWAWVTSSTVPTAGNSGYAAALTVDDANYDYTSVEGYNATTHKVTRTVSLTVNKATVTVTAPTAKTLTYTGKAQALVEAGKVTGGTMQYSLDGKAFSETIPTGTEAKTYTVSYKVVGDANHNDTAAKTVSVTIGKVAINPTVSLKGWTCGESANTPVVTGNSGNGKVTFTYAAKGSTAFTATVPAETGEYIVKASIAETTNYLGGEATASFTIKSGVIVWDMEDLKNILIKTGEKFTCDGVTLVSVKGEAGFKSNGARFNGYH